MDKSREDGVASAGFNGVVFNKTFTKKSDLNFPVQKTKVFYRNDFNPQKYEDIAVEFDNLKNNKSFQEKIGLNKSTSGTNKTKINTPLDQDQEKRKICWYAQNNKCKFGINCFNFHPPKNNEMYPIRNDGPYPEKSNYQENQNRGSTTGGHFQTAKTYSSVVRGCLGEVGGSQPAPSDQQIFSNKCP